MTAPAAIQLEADEPLCAECIQRQGLCHAHERHVLPQLAQPMWPRLIGEGYVCTRAECGEHARCLDVPGAESPRAGCPCHACAQQRAARVHARREARAMTADVERATLKARRNRARKQAQGVGRLARALRGEFTPARPIRPRKG